jgi:hypothetical protein
MRCNLQNLRENKIYAGIPHIKHITSHTCILAALVKLVLVREGIELCRLCMRIGPHHSSSRLEH